MSRTDIEVPGYALMELLGSGGQGRVYRAVCQTTRAEVALKLTGDLSPRRLEAFEGEVEALMQLGSRAPSHPGDAHPYTGAVLPILDAGHTDACAWYVMPLMRGRTLDRLFCSLQQDTPAVEIATEPVSMLDFGDVEPIEEPRSTQRPYPWSVVVALLRALDEVHSQGFVHGDLKPSNIFMRQDGRILLADFGMAVRTQDAWGRERLRALRSRGGTRRYMAPEQLAGVPIDGRADLYALGQMLLRSGVEGQNKATARVVEHLMHPLPEGRPFRGLDVARELAAALDKPPPEWSYPFPRLRPAFVGRRGVLSVVARWCEQPNGSPHTLCLVGEPGAGKTRTLAEVARVLGERAMVVSAHSGELWADLVRQVPLPHDNELRSSVRVLSSGRQVPMPQRVAALTHVLNALPCAFVIVDDLDRLDASHRGVLTASCIRAHKRVIASSTEALGSCETHTLPRLNDFEARALLISMLGHVEHDAIEALIARSMGNPQILVEQAHHFRTAGGDTPSPTLVDMIVHLF